MIAIWDKRLSVGDSVLDAEHRQVISLLNEIAVASSVGAPAIIIQKALESLSRAIDRHFARDEYPHGEHAAIAALARRLCEAGPPTADRRALMNLARRWLDHMGRREPDITQQRLAG
ncbi:MAG: hypothetical protein HY055_14600 [Magnetospirillum sp.]|nr:hypothetical protein [Magnetospirillum sp.]